MPSGCIQNAGVLCGGLDNTANNKEHLKRPEIEVVKIPSCAEYDRAVVQKRNTVGAELTVKAQYPRVGKRLSRHFQTSP